MYEMLGKKAAACEAHAKATDDRKLQVMFRKLRDSWVRIGNDAQFADDAMLTRAGCKSLIKESRRTVSLWALLAKNELRR